MSEAATRPLRVFLAHASGDKHYVRSLNQLLRIAGFEPWLDEDRLVAGQDWELEIEKAVKRSDAIAIFLSESAVKTAGYVHKEMALALEAAQRQPEGALYRVPIRLDATEPPSTLRHLHWIDVQGVDRIEPVTKAGWKIVQEISRAYEECRGFMIGESYLRLQRALLTRIEQVGPSITKGSAFDAGRYLVHGRRPDGGEYFGSAHIEINHSDAALDALIAGHTYEYSGRVGWGFIQLSGPQDVSYIQTGQTGVLAGTWGNGGLEELIPLHEQSTLISPE